MASPPVLNLDALLTDIPGEDPAGLNLREDYSPASLYQSIKVARTKARAAERKADEGDASAEPDWSPVLELVPEALSGKTKDLELTAWYIEALLREHGFAGLRDGFRLAGLLVEKFWDRLFPRPDEEGVVNRVAALGGLNGLDGGEGTLIAPINRVLLTEDRGAAGPFARWHYRQAADLEAIVDPERREKRIASGAVTQELIRQAEAATSYAFSQNLLEDLTECVEGVEKLGRLLEEKCGKDAAGTPLAPPSSLIRTALKECREIVEGMAASKAPQADEGPEGAGTAPGGEGGADSPGPGTGKLRGREEAFQALLRVAQFFKQTEPHSPVSYALERIVRWGRMPLPDLLNELIAEEGTRSSVFKLVGIPPKEESPPPG